MKPVLTNYLDLSQYLQDYYQFRKNGERDFSYQKWSQELDIKNKSYLRFLVLGRRPLTEKVLLKLVDNLALDASDALYLRALANYSQAKNINQKRIFGQTLIGMLKLQKDAAVIEPHYELLSNSVLTKLLTLLSFDDIRKDVKTLANLLMRTESEINEGIQTLIKLGAVEKSGDSGSDEYKSTQKSFKIADDFNGLGLRNYYNNIFEEAGAAISLPKDQRRFRSLLLAMSKEELQSYFERLDQFAKEQLVQHDVHDLRGRKIYQLHFNVFPVTQQPEEILNTPEMRV